MSKSAISYAEVKEYFASVDPQMGELVLQIASDALAANKARREAMGKRLVKARAAKGKVAAQAAQPAAQPAPRQRARRQEQQAAQPAQAAQVAEEVVA